MNNATLSDLVTRTQQRVRELQPVDRTQPIGRFVYLPNPDNGQIAAVDVVKGESGSNEVLHLTRRAELQLFEHLGLPSRYADRIREFAPELLAENLLSLAHRAPGVKDRQQLLRTIGGNTVRAILSPSYAPIDDVDVFPAVADIVADEPDAEVKVLDHGNGDYTHVRIVFPRMAFEPRVGDVIQAGLHVSNSEVGLRAVTIAGLAYRLVCTNGAVREDREGSTKFRHIGNPERIKDAMRQAIRDAKVGARQILDQFRKAVEHRLTDGHLLLHAFGQDQGMSEDLLKRLVAKYDSFQDPTLFGAVNSITELAHQAPTFEGRYQLERAATALLARAA